MNQIAEVYKSLLNHQYDEQIDELNSLQKDLHEYYSLQDKLHRESNSQVQEDKELDLTKVRRELYVLNQRIKSTLVRIRQLKDEIPSPIHSSVPEEDYNITKGDQELYFFDYYSFMYYFLSGIKEELTRFSVQYNNITELVIYDEFNMLFELIVKIKNQLKALAQEKDLKLVELGQVSCQEKGFTKALTIPNLITAYIKDAQCLVIELNNNPPLDIN